MQPGRQDKNHRKVSLTHPCSVFHLLVTFAAQKYSRPWAQKGTIEYFSISEERDWEISTYPESVELRKKKTSTSFMVSNILHSKVAVTQQSVLTPHRGQKNTLSCISSSLSHQCLGGCTVNPGFEVGDVSAVCRTATLQDQLSLLLGQNPEHGDLQGYGLGKGLHKPAHFQRHETGRFPQNLKTCPGSCEWKWPMPILGATAGDSDELLMAP